MLQNWSFAQLSLLDVVYLMRHFCFVQFPVQQVNALLDLVHLHSGPVMSTHINFTVFSTIR